MKAFEMFKSSVLSIRDCVNDHRTVQNVWPLRWAHQADDQKFFDFHLLRGDHRFVLLVGKHKLG
jgi:hypothetical protein